MKLGDKAAETPDVDLARQSAPGAYRLLTDELTPADELTAEGEFPQYGDFLEVGRLGQTGDGVEVKGEQYIECPAGLAKWLVDEISVGDDFRVVSVQKVDGEWQYDCEQLE
jgi:hypothetical protein